jgi:hypothetical protein
MAKSTVMDGARHHATRHDNNEKKSVNCEPLLHMRLAQGTNMHTSVIHLGQSSFFFFFLVTSEDIITFEPRDNKIQLG